MFKRKFYDEMLEWKNRDQGASALLIEGARRVGKSTIAEAFAKREYDSYLAIDFSEAPQEVLDLFRQYRQDLETFFTYLSAYYEVNLVPRHSVIIFDEVQSFPPAREFIKRLVADGRFDYIETGSLLSIHQNQRYCYSFRGAVRGVESLGFRRILVGVRERTAGVCHSRLIRAYEAFAFRAA